MNTYQRVVIKIGTSNLVDKQGTLDILAMTRFVSEMSEVQKHGIDFVLVTSGAVAAGSNLIQLQKNYLHHRKQILAAIGQNLLINKYSRLFDDFGIRIAQLLLVREDLDNRKLYLNTRETLRGLLSHRIIPIVNENDVVTAGSFGGNDLLAAAVCGLVDADLLLILTNVEGIYQVYPPNENEKPLSQIPAKNIDALLKKQNEQTSGLGTGGVLTKLQAAKLATEFGTATIIANGSRSDSILDAILAKTNRGTLVQPQITKLEARKRWLLYGIKPKGTITIDQGAAHALLHQGSSLLAVGVTQAEGIFGRGDAVQIYNCENQKVAVGLTNFNSSEIAHLQGKKTSEIKNILNDFDAAEVIHRDNLVLV